MKLTVTLSLTLKYPCTHDSLEEIVQQHWVLQTVRCSKMKIYKDDERDGGGESVKKTHYPDFKQKDQCC